jgi:hypothetical protein
MSNTIANPTFLTTLQNILTLLEDDVAPLIQDNVYLTLVNELQVLYNIHSASVKTNVANVSNVSNISNVSNFNNVLPVLITMYDSMSYVQRERAYENNNYRNLMNTARNFWNAMSLDEQREYRSNMGQSEIEFGGPVHRIIYPRS